MSTISRFKPINKSSLQIENASPANRGALLAKTVAYNQPRLDPSKMALLKRPKWQLEDLPHVLSSTDGHGGDGWLLTISDRLKADTRFTGKGVTICMIDAGFVVHPDLSRPSNRIRAVVDVANPSTPESFFFQSHPENGHGTMTSVACAGNGYLSGGHYQGLAKDAELTLFRVMRDGHISDESIAKAINWATNDQDRHGVRIISMSVYGDYADDCGASLVCAEAKRAFESGVLPIAAVGNDQEGPIYAPAMSPHVLAVGGIDDQNTDTPDDDVLYHSTYGLTADGCLKPDIVAPAHRIPSATLPGTGAAYTSMGGTSIAAPIVASVAAQVLEANPNLTARDVYAVLLDTAVPLPGVSIRRQGLGVVNAKAAVQRALAMTKTSRDRGRSPVIDSANGKIRFYYRNPFAGDVKLAGSFTSWGEHAVQMQKVAEDLYMVELPMLSGNRHEYKFVVDSQYKCDPENAYRRENSFGTLNSVVRL